MIGARPEPVLTPALPGMPMVVGDTGATSTMQPEAVAAIAAARKAIESFFMIWGPLFGGNG
ncbi:hypothetical protein D3C72_955110 [compost metagenome]